MLRRPMSPVWYLKRGPYVVFMLREFTSLFNALYGLLLLLLLSKWSESSEAYDAFLAFLGSPWMIPLHVVALASSVLHTVTWFNATGKAVVIRWGEARLSDAALAAPNYAAWALVTVLVLRLALRG